MSVAVLVHALLYLTFHCCDSQITILRIISAEFKESCLKSFVKAAARFTVLGLDAKAAYEEQKAVTYLMITINTLKKQLNTPYFVNT